MGLKELYEGGDPKYPYVNTVRTRQAADAGAINGVNFMDGTPRTQGNNAPDEYQDEFKRNEQGSFRYGGNSKVPGSQPDTSYLLSRWLEKSLKIAFDGEGPTTQPAGYWQNNRFTTLNDPRNGSAKVHNYAPKVGKTFYEDASLSQFAKNRADPKATIYGPTPGGING